MQSGKTLRESASTTSLRDFARTHRKVLNKIATVLSLIVVALTVNVIAFAQSSDIASPSPIGTSEITGTIGARDIGDPRLTDHYYSFTGTPGDVMITVDSRNLNGDIDVFTSTGLRPLLKITVYSSNTAPITKSIYLRKREDLILRVEARSPNDDEGTYRLTFSGSFEPMAGGPSTDETKTSTEQTVVRGKKGRRVSSVGARINEPPPVEVAAAPTPEPTPLETAEKPAPSVETKTEETAEAKTVTPKASARNARGRRGAPRRGRTPAKPKVVEPVENTERASTPPGEEPTAPTPVPTVPRRTTKRGGTARRSAEEETAGEISTTAESGPKLLIETNDGTLINRYMSSVRRVTVENGQVVVVGKDGKIQRIPLGSVVRMSIAP